MTGTCLAVLLAFASSDAAEPNGDANEVAQSKQAILDLLAELSRPENSGWLVGQNAGHANYDLAGDYRRYVLQLERMTADFPALLGLDLGMDQIPPLIRHSVTLRIAKQQWDRGGLVTISMHPRSPFHNSNAHDVRPADWNRLDVEGSIEQLRWRRTVDKVAAVLSQLQQQGIVVLWRPFHEMNGGWFWWCARQGEVWTTRDEFVRLWRRLHDDFEKRGLDNLLWVYAPNVQTDEGQRSADYYYPGDAYVDVVGLDWYDDNFENADTLSSYTQLAQLNKPMGLTEVGPLSKRDGTFDSLSIATAMQRYPRFGFALIWHGWKDAKLSLSEDRHAAQLFTKDEVLTLKDLRSQNLLNLERRDVGK